MADVQYDGAGAPIVRPQVNYQGSEFVLDGQGPPLNAPPIADIDGPPPVGISNGVRGIAVVMQRVLGASGAESLNIAANVFMGQSEAPLTIRPYLARLTESELMAVMTGGMATISGALLIAYVRIGGVPVEHLLTAVIMTAPACLMLAKVMVPETETPETFGKIPKDMEQPDVNLIDAAANGTIVNYLPTQGKVPTLQIDGGSTGITVLDERLTLNGPGTRPDSCRSWTP